MNECILVVDDDPEIVRAIAILLEKEGYQVLKAYNGMEALEQAVNPALRLIVIDVMMPRLDGLSAVMKIREKRNLPIIVLSAKSEDSDKVLGLSMGADDYIAKPFEALELLARVEVALRRRGKGREVLEYRGIQQDLSSHTVTLNGKPVALSPKEFELLRVFLQNQDLALSRDKLLSLVWGYDFAGETRTVDIHVQRLRQKLGLSGKLVTLPRIGYRLEH